MASPFRFLPLALLTLGLCPAGMASLDSTLSQNQCYVCHDMMSREIYERPLFTTDELAHDIHLNKGILCHDCHGGDPTSDDAAASMDPAKGFIPSPTHETAPAFCGRCHSDASYMARFNPKLPVDQVSKYYTSHHGQRLRQGDEKVANCISCHGAHGMYEIENVNSPVYHLNIVNTCAKCHADPMYMADYEIPTDQYKEYVNSVHGVALLEKHDRGAPACNDCHGNHGAVPPGVESVAHICSVCHALIGEYFANSPHKAAFDANHWSECIQCHGNHNVQKPSDAMLGGQPPSVCIACHKEESDAGFSTAVHVKRALEELTTKQADAEAKYQDARNKGMEVGEIELLLRDVHQRVIRARALIHTISEAVVLEETGEGIGKATEAREMADAAIHEYVFRRQGLGISTLIITVLAGLLYLKIRQVRANRTH